MRPKDPKKIEHAGARSEIAKEITIIKNLKLISKEKQEELIQDLLAYKKVTETKKGEIHNHPTEYLIKKESKETLTKSLEFEEDTFKIDSKGWKEVTNKDKDDPILSKFVGKKPKVKVNATGDVLEYLKGDAKGEQIFLTYDAFIREVCKTKNCSKEEAEKKYLMTVDEFKEKMKDKPNNSEEYKKFFNQEVQNHLAGFWDTVSEKFYYVGEYSCMWLAGGGNADFMQDGSYCYNYDRYYGVSGRLLKN